VVGEYTWKGLEERIGVFLPVAKWLRRRRRKGYAANAKREVLIVVVIRHSHATVRKKTTAS